MCDILAFFRVFFYPHFQTAIKKGVVEEEEAVFERLAFKCAALKPRITTKQSGNQAVSCVNENMTLAMLKDPVFLLSLFRLHLKMLTWWT